MTILRNVSLLLVASTAIFSVLNCFENPLLKKLKEEVPVVTKPETLLGSTLVLAGLPLVRIGSKKYTLTRRLLFRSPGLAIMGTGIASIGNSINEKYKWIK